MNLYDRIKPGKRRRGWGGAVFLAAACVVLVICIGTIGWAARYHQRYRRFSTDFAASCDGQSVECGANISLYNSNSQTFSESTNLPPQGSGYLQLMLMVPKGWQNLQITYMPTFVQDKTITFIMTSADVTKA